MPFIVAVSVESKLVTQFLSSSLAFRSNVIDFHLIRFSEHQTAPSTLALLLLEQHGERSSCRWVVFQSLAPVQEITIIWAGSSFYFHMPSDFRRTMPSQVIILWCCKDAALAFAFFPVSLPGPMPVFVLVSASCPSPKQLLEDVVASTVFCLRADGPVVVRPSPDDRTEFLDQRSLRC